MFRKKHDNPDGDDMLVAIRRDGNVIIDREIRQELGMVLSDRYNMAIRNDELVSFVEWLRADAPPISMGNSFFLADEPKHPGEDSTIMFRVLPSLYNKAALGKTQLQVAEARRKQVIKGVLASSVAACFVVTFAIVPLCKPPQVISLPDSVVQEIIEAQEEQRAESVEQDIRRLLAEQKRLEGKLNGEPAPTPVPSAAEPSPRR